MNDDLLAQLEAVASSRFQPVTVGDLTVPLRPVSVTEVIRLARRFPKLETALLGIVEEAVATGGIDIAKLNVGSLLSIALHDGPEALAALIAVSAGAAGDARAEAAFAKQPDDILFPLVAAVKDLTAPEGLEPFFARLGAMLMAEKGRKPAAKVAEKRVRRAA